MLGRTVARNMSVRMGDDSMGFHSMKRREEESE